MADPVIVPCPADVWTKVATNVTAGQVHIKDTRPGDYLQTYRMTGGAAPDAGDPSEVAKITGPFALIEATAGIDVYIMPLGAAGWHFPVDSDGSIGIFQKYGAPL